MTEQASAVQPIFLSLGRGRSIYKTAVTLPLSVVVGHVATCLQPVQDTKIQHNSRAPIDRTALSRTAFPRYRAWGSDLARTQPAILLEASEPVMQHYQDASGRRASSGDQVPLLGDYLPFWDDGCGQSMLVRSSCAHPASMFPCR